MGTPPIGVQAALLGTAAAGLAGYAASREDMTDGARVVTGGMAGTYGLASAWSGFKVWGAISAGVVAGTLGGTLLAKLGADDSVRGASLACPTESP